jgi:cytoskeletal protein RodZ
MKNMRMRDLIRREAKAVLRLSPWMLVSLALALGVLRADLIATSGIFQSPATSTPTSEATATSEVPEATATEAQPTIQPTQTLVPTATMTDVPPTATEEPATPTTLAPTATITLPPAVDSVAATPTVDERQRYADEGTGLVFEWGTLFDSVALGVSYLWLCCGLFVFLLIPLVFVVLWVASRRRGQQQE